MKVGSGCEKIIESNVTEILNRNGFEGIAFIDPLDALMAAESRCPDILLSDAYASSSTSIFLNSFEMKARTAVSGENTGLRLSTATHRVRLGSSSAG